MPTHLLSPTSGKHRPQAALHPDLTLLAGRAHEVCGPARRSFAIWLAGQMQGEGQMPGEGQMQGGGQTVLWISPAWENAHLHPAGMLPFVDPARFLFIRPHRSEDLLWCAEEALRAGAASLVVADLPAPPALTPVRRLHLAAETGAKSAATPPLGLLLTPGDGGAQGVESRWHIAPAHDAKTRRWHLERRRARALPPKRWALTQARPRAAPDITPLTIA